MYPIALEKQYQRFFVSEFRKLAEPFTKAVIKRLKKEIKADSDDSMRADSLTQLMLFLSELKEEYGNKIQDSILEQKIKKNYAMIDAWSRDKTTEAIGKVYARLNTPQPAKVTGRPTPAGKSGELWMTTVNLRQNLNEELLNKVTKQNVMLINKAYSEHFDDMTGILKNGILSGKGSRAIAEELQAATGVNYSKAKFWARDQASKFFGETTKIRQIDAGIPGYIWRCVGDNKTRDSHLMLDGTYHAWNDPPLVQTTAGPRKLNPGDDYNCRCWAEPATGPEMAEREFVTTISSGKNKTPDSHSIITNTEPIDIKDSRLVDAKFDEFAQQYINSEIETALIISAKGKAFTVKGTQGNVAIDIVGDENLKGAKIIHNHPDLYGDSGDCFSIDDLVAYFTKEMDELQVVNRAARYSFKSKTKLTENKIRDFYNKAYKSALEHAFKKGLELDFEQLRTMEELAKKHRFIKFREIKK